MPETPTTPTTTNDLWEAMSTQRAIRYYKPDAVPADLIQKTIEAATRFVAGKAAGDDELQDRGDGERLEERGSHYRTFL